jgi:hypothetical protein
VILSPFKPPANTSPAASPRIHQNGKRRKRGKAVQNKDHKLCGSYRHQPRGRNALNVVAFQQLNDRVATYRLVLTYSVLNSSWPEEGGRSQSRCNVERQPQCRAWSCCRSPFIRRFSRGFRRWRFCNCRFRTTSRFRRCCSCEHVPLGGGVGPGCSVTKGCG